MDNSHYMRHETQPAEKKTWVDMKHTEPFGKRYPDNIGKTTKLKSVEYDDPEKHADSAFKRGKALGLLQLYTWVGNI